MPQTKKNIVVIGAGEVGVTFSIIISELAEAGFIPDNFSITLINNTDDILSGATNAANVNHESGYEYLKPGHAQTGIDCIHGGITKKLFFNTSLLDSGIENRFLISTDTIESNIASFEDFENNVNNLRSVYTRAFDYIKEARGWSTSEAREYLHNSPEEFGVKLSAEEIPELQHIAGGYKAAGGSVKMAYSYSIKKSLLQKYIRKQIVHLLLKQQVESIENYGSKYFVKMEEGYELVADLVVITAAHQNARLASKVKNGAAGSAGMYHLNGMLYLKLHPQKENELIRIMSQVNFVLQGDGGCMYACCVPPSSADPGYAAVYYPSERGSQIEKHFYDSSKPVSAPSHWDEWIHNGLPEDIKRKRLETIYNQLYRFNPFLKGCVSELNFVVRTVFNPVVEANENGRDRRVRELTGVKALTKDHRVLTATSPKWTNVELSALSVIEEAISQLWNIHLPKHEDGLGPEKIDVEFLTRKVNFQQARHSEDMVHHYQRKLNLPLLLQEEDTVTQLV